MISKVVLPCLLITLLPSLNVSNDIQEDFQHAYELYCEAHKEDQDVVELCDIAVSYNENYYECINNEWMIIDNADRVGYPVDKTMYDNVSFYYLYKEEDLKEALFEVLPSFLSSLRYPYNPSSLYYSTHEAIIDLCFRNIEEYNLPTSEPTHFITSFKRELPNNVDFYEEDMVKLIYVGELIIQEDKYKEDSYDVVKIINLGNENRVTGKVKIIHDVDSIASIKIEGDENSFIPSYRNEVPIYQFSKDIIRNRMSKYNEHFYYPTCVSRNDFIYYSVKDVSSNKDPYKLPSQKCMTGLGYYRNYVSHRFMLYGVYEDLEVSFVKSDKYDQNGNRYCSSVYFINYAPEGHTLTRLIVGKIM